ncbi:MAG: mechanosensitive ion channel [Bacteroidia bacterium]|nr:mechanosensitive ion channel [Bacteroidia bacterium]
MNRLAVIARHPVMRRRLREGVWLLFKSIALLALLYVDYRYRHMTADLGLGSSYVRALLSLLTGILFIDFARITITGFYIRRRRLEWGERDNFIVGISQLASIAGAIVLALSLLIALDIKIREALTAISIVAAAMAILFKDYVANMINGMILLFSDQISIGDTIKIGQHKGRISDVTLLNVHLINDDEEVIYIPNNTVLSTEVVNYTKRAVKRIGVEFEMGFQHLDQLSELEAYLQGSLGDYESYLIPESSVLKVAAVAKDSATLKFQTTFREEPEAKLEKAFRRYLMRKVLEYVDSRT